MGFKENFKAEISYNGMSVKELAMRADVKKRAIDNYLRTKGAALPSADTAVKLARALGVTVEFLVLGEKYELPADIIHINRELLKLSPKERSVVAVLADAMVKYAS